MVNGYRGGENHVEKLVTRAEKKKSMTRITRGQWGTEDEPTKYRSGFPQAKKPERENKRN